jgi:hypothetical protein
VRQRPGLFGGTIVFRVVFYVGKCSDQHSAEADAHANAYTDSIYRGGGSVGRDPDSQRVR